MNGIKTPQNIIDRVIELRTSGLSAQTVCAVLEIPSSTASHIWTKHLKQQIKDEPVLSESKESAIDWQMKYAEAIKQIAHLIEINDLLKENISLLKSLR